MRATTDDMNWWRVFKIIILTKRILCFVQPRKTELCLISQKWEMTVLSVCNPSQDIIELKTSPNWKSPSMPLVEQRGKICSRETLFKVTESCALGKRVARYLGGFLLKLLELLDFTLAFLVAKPSVVFFLLVPASTAGPVQLRKWGTLNSNGRVTWHKFNIKVLILVFIYREITVSIYL